MTSLDGEDNTESIKNLDRREDSFKIKDFRTRYDSINDDGIF